MRDYQPLSGVSQATLIDFFYALDAVKRSGDPGYLFQTKSFLASVGGFTTPVLNSILKNLTEYRGGPMVHKIASDVGFILKVPNARQFLTIEKIENHWKQDWYYEERARANVAYDYDADTGELIVKHFPEDG